MGRGHIRSLVEGSNDATVLDTIHSLTRRPAPSVYTDSPELPSPPRSSPPPPPPPSPPPPPPLFARRVPERGVPETGASTEGHVRASEVPPCLLCPPRGSSDSQTPRRSIQRGGCLSVNKRELPPPPPPPPPPSPNKGRVTAQTPLNPPLVPHQGARMWLGLVLLRSRACCRHVNNTGNGRFGSSKRKPIRIVSTFHTSRNVVNQELIKSSAPTQRSKRNSSLKRLDWLYFLSGQQRQTAV